MLTVDVQKTINIQRVTLSSYAVTKNIIGKNGNGFNMIDLRCLRGYATFILQLQVNRMRTNRTVGNK